jgi:hypothetical protein
MEALKTLLKRLYYLIITLPRDLQIITSMASIEWKYKKLEESNEPIHRLFGRIVKQHPEKACILYEDETWTYQAVNVLG